MPERKPKTQHSIDPVTFDDPHSKVFECPCCNARLQFKVKVNVFGVYELGENDELQPKRPPVGLLPMKDRFTEGEQRLIAELRENGIYSAFETAVNAALQTNIPKNMGRYLLTFLTRALPIKSPQFAIRQCLPEGDAAGNLEMWCLNQTVAVLADGEFRVFLPLSLVRGEKLKSLTAGNGTINKQEGMDVSEWVRTRHGYVAGRGALFTEMRKKAAGSFANTGI
jgi:hypothetical protein